MGPSAGMEVGKGGRARDGRADGDEDGGAAICMEFFDDLDPSESEEPSL